MLRNSILKLMGVAGCMLVVFIFSASTVFSDELIAHYSFDDSTARDNSGNGHHGTISGAIPYNGGMQFDGINDYIDILNLLDYKDNFSICAWVRLSDLDNLHRIMVGATSGDNHDVFLSKWIDNKIRWLVRTSSGQVSVYSNEPLSANQLYFVVGTRVRGGPQKLYIDGEPVSEAQSYNQNNWFGNISIGALNTNGGHGFYFYGFIDEVRFYDYAIPDSLVRFLYRSYYPLIYGIIRTPFFPEPGQPCEVSAIIFDTTGIDYANLYYDTGYGFVSVHMNNMADSFFATISGQNQGTSVHYYIAAKNNEGDSTVSDTSSYYVMDDNVLTVMMSPLIYPIEVPTGGFFEFDGFLLNNSPVNQVADVWIMLELPYGGPYGPIKQFNDLPLYPYQFAVSNNVRQRVPGYAPLGIYDYISYCGRYPSEIVDSASFQFTVICTGTGAGSDEWKLSGWFENKEGHLIPVPEQFALLPNFPNPFNATTTIAFELAEPGNVHLDIYNLMGQKVETLVDGPIEAGYHTVQWNASQYSSGIYFYKLTAGDKVFTRKMTLLK